MHFPSNTMIRDLYHPIPIHRKAVIAGFGDVGAKDRKNSGLERPGVFPAEDERPASPPTGANPLEMAADAASTRPRQ